MRYAFAGDREISIKILGFLKTKGYNPLVLIVNNQVTGTHTEELIKMSGLSKDKIFYGDKINSLETISILKDLKIDYVLGIHFPFIISEKVLAIPKIGFLNLHPAYLPFNKGWHTPTWAILDKTPYGASLHFMNNNLDSGDIVHQKMLKISPSDTAHTLYQKVLKLEFEVFKESFNELLSLNPKRIHQVDEGTKHTKNDLKRMQEIQLQEYSKNSEFINKLRAFTTNNVKESLYFIEDGEKYYLQIKIIKENKV